MVDLMLDDLSRNYLRIEYEPVSIERYGKGNRGIPYVWTFSAKEPGPHAVICGIVHGNEICGATVLDRMMRAQVRPPAGTLSFCFGNPAAYATFDKAKPHLSRDVDIDLNRVWGPELKDPDRTESEIVRARELEPLFREADYVLDLHSMQGAGPATAVIQDTGRTLELAKRLTTIPFLVTGEIHDPSLIRLRNYGRFGSPDSSAVALQVEAGQHWRAETVDVAERIAYQFLEAIGLRPGVDRPHRNGQTVLRVIDIPRCRGDGFRFVADFANASFFPSAGTPVATEGDLTIETPQDDCYLIMPVHFRRPKGTIGRFAVRV